MIFISDVNLSNFSKIVIFGIVIGTYSSICIAPSLLIVSKTKRKIKAAINANDPMRFI